MVSASPHIQAFAKNAGADDAIEKPFKMKELRDIVTKHLK
jgi:DNA-binding response OmpR family regulator